LFLLYVSLNPKNKLIIPSGDLSGHGRSAVLLVQDQANSGSQEAVRKSNSGHQVLSSDQTNGAQDGVNTPNSHMSTGQGSSAPASLSGIQLPLGYPQRILAAIGRYFKKYRDIFGVRNLRNAAIASSTVALAQQLCGSMTTHMAPPSRLERSMLIANHLSSQYNSLLQRKPLHQR
jgi:hypothetical protein